MQALVAPAAQAAAQGQAAPALQQQVVDARSAGRFQGVEPEPRPGLRPGHMPGARNVPFPQVCIREVELWVGHGERVAYCCDVQGCLLGQAAAALLRAYASHARLFCSAVLCAVFAGVCRWSDVRRQLEVSG
jgi:hypothetical protein